MVSFSNENGIRESTFYKKILHYLQFANDRICLLIETNENVTLELARKRI